MENAQRKAATVAVRGSGDVVLGVDTVVALAGRIYDKPRDAAEARHTLSALSGLRHAVISGVCLIGRGEERTAAVHTAVQFRQLSSAVVDWYLASGEWRDRAGGYAIQGKGAALVASIEGDYLNVVGLPLAMLLDLEPALLPKSSRRTCQ